MMNAGLYIHIPFCLKKCPYCDFYSITDVSLQPAFLNALSSEMRMTGGVELVFDTIYIGGGTPSILDVKTIGQIIEIAIQSFEILSGAEITLAINPGTVTPEQLEGYRSAGVNRINIWLQSFDPHNLSFLGRIHSRSDADLAVKWAKKAGFENIGFDLIYGIPGQTRESWLFDLRRAVEYEPEHLSCYMLTFEPGTPLGRDRSMGRFKPLADDLVGEMFKTTLEYLSAHGYNQYEISNFARACSTQAGNNCSEDNRSRHNMKHWSFAPYIGLGPSAHSFIEPQRYWNCTGVKKYIQELASGRFPLEGDEWLSPEQLMIEAVYLGLRQTRGIMVDVFDKKFGVSFELKFKEVISDLEKKGFIEFSPNHCALTPKGMLLFDSIAAMFI